MIYIDRDVVWWDKETNLSMAKRTWCLTYHLQFNQSTRVVLAILKPTLICMSGQKPEKKVSHTDEQGGMNPGLICSGLCNYQPEANLADWIPSISSGTRYMVIK